MISAALSALLAVRVAAAPGGTQPPEAAAAVSTGAALDLHSHSYCSDGADAPETLVAQAKEAGIDVLALTDHDTLACVARASSAAEALGLRFVPGIELSTEDDTMHLLGLGVRVDDPRIAGIIEGNRNARIRRIRKTLELLDAHGVHISLKDVLVRKLRYRREMDKDRLPPYPPGELEGRSEAALLKELGSIPLIRPDIAWVMLEKGYVVSYKEAFNKYLSTQGCCRVDLDGPTYRQVIDAVHHAGGFVSLAHPYTLYEFEKFPHYYSGRRFADFESVAQALLDAGLDAVEQYKPNRGPAPRVTAVLAKYRERSKREILLTAGSDYHGGPRGGVGPAKLSRIAIPKDDADKLLRRLKIQAP